jgi:hypothetical protein
MKRVYFVLGLLMCIASAQGQWQQVGFLGRDVECMAHHPQDTSIMLAGIVDSIFHSTDGGSSWAFICHFNGLPINCLMYDPTYYDTVYALLGDGTYSDGIYRSTDGGNNWDVLEWLYRPRDMALTRPGRIMLVGCYGPGVFKSEDEGNTWILWNDALVDSHVHTVDYCWAPGSTLVGLAGTSQGLFYRLYTAPWVQAGGIPVNLRVSSIDHSRNMQLGFASVTGGSWSDGVYRTTDNGYTWQVVDWWIYSSAVVMNPLWQDYPNDTCGIFAGDSGLGVKYSDDCGTNWQEVNSGLGNLYINALSYHPQDSMLLFAATQDGLYRYEYGPGVAENRIDDPNVSAFRVSTVHRVGRPIALISSMTGTKGLSLLVTVYDASGRLERTEILGPRSSALAPIHESGVYFLTVAARGVRQKEKIIVID